MTLEDNESVFSPVVPFRTSDRLKKEILEGKRYEGHSFDPDRGVLNVEGSAADAAPVAFVAFAWLIGGAAYVGSANTWSFMDMGGTKGVIVSNCFPKCLGKGDRLNPNEFLSPVRLAPSGRASGFLYFPHPASSGKVNIAIRAEGGAPVKPFSFSLNNRCLHSPRGATRRYPRPPNPFPELDGNRSVPTSVMSRKTPQTARNTALGRAGLSSGDAPPLGDGAGLTMKSGLTAPWTACRPRNTPRP